MHELRRDLCPLMDLYRILLARGWAGKPAIRLHETPHPFPASHTSVLAISRLSTLGSLPDTSVGCTEIK